MTVREQLQAEVEELDEETAEMVLAFVRGLTAPATKRSPNLGSFEERSQATKPAVHVNRESLRQIARPLTENDALWGIVGILGDDGPSDMSSNKHKYLAEIYGDLHEE